MPECSGEQVKVGAAAAPCHRCDRLDKECRTGTNLEDCPTALRRGTLSGVINESTSPLSCSSKRCLDNGFACASSQRLPCGEARRISEQQVAGGPFLPGAVDARPR